jgi:ABC-type multidrug transport system ATPase subunit
MMPGSNDSRLSIRDLTVRYPGSGADAVAHVSLEVRDERNVIVGANGSGKTSLLRAALGLLPMDGGSVRVFGQHVGQIRGETRVGTNLAEVYRLMTLPVDRLITVWCELKGASEGQMREWFREFGLIGHLDRPIHRLSTGQMKTVGDLLALCGPAELLLLDEPFDNVDFARRRRYLDLLAGFPAGVVMNTHELDLLHFVPDWRLFFMFEGHLVGPFLARDLDRLYVSKGPRPDEVARFDSSFGAISVTLDEGDLPMKGVSNLGYLLERIP